MRFTLLALVCASGFAVPAAAQDAPLRLTVEEAVRRADENSGRVAAARARADAAEAAQAGRAAADRPAVALLGGYTRTNHVDEFAIAMPGSAPRLLYPDAPDNYRARLDLQWPIYTAGRIAALERSAGAEREAAGFDVEAARADVRLETIRAFWALVTAEQTQQVLARALERAGAHVGDLRSRLDQGLIPPNELLSAEAQRAHERVLAVEAGNLRDTAEADLRRLIGEPGARRIEPVAPADPPPAPEAAGDVDAGRRRPEWRALDRRVAASREREAAVDAAGRPQLALAGGYDYARPNPRIFPRLDEWRGSWDASVNVSWSVWDGGRRSAERAEAAAGTRALVSRAADLDRDIAFEIDARRLEVQSAYAAIPAADEGVRAAVEARRVVQERFDAGVATSTDVLDAATAVLQAELDRTRAVANARLAVARLERALGR
jgi:outer membrane protein TolC